MSILKRLVLDVLKPHLPNGLDFAKTLADLEPGYHVKYEVIEVDSQTESVVITIEGDDIKFDLINEAIKSMGGSLHSVDEIEIINQKPVDETV